MSYKLAIVIPAYKTQYLNAALASIAAQTNKNFKVYVCDDGSKEDIKAITDRYTNQLDIVYHRFDENLGKTGLVKHWNRSVETTNEEWVWLFSDDDIMAPGCAQAFFDALELTSGQHNLYRFNIEMIDAEGEIICIKEPHPITETGYEFLKGRLQSRSLSAAVEYIFKREIFVAANGFVSFPLAYCSDDASWIEFAGQGQIYTIHPEKVYWRSSGINISSAKGLQDKKVDSLIKFIEYASDKFPDKRNELLNLSEEWFFNSLIFIGGHLSLLQSLLLFKRLGILFPDDKVGLAKKILSSRLKFTRFSGKADKWLKN
ncbi:glycosyltransferase family 2 protein [Mucilaginibacter sp. X4EP1]|uniref:glycosyltransferase family 2 protein n=1 Tax=Mucilaginibacter sp. X4EP1 TaxID=2723092 RepID=UPI002169F5F4|nr:glycosyltransferase family A protein [Mucilaginibacter sp. X4EP1]MCS3811715.1 glycosyltransferase involved in cell wall biosynthesis [Mucilaginibacter sp. X4EP1]